MIKQLATTVYCVSDLNQAKQWMKQIFELEPYFDETFYVGFNIEGCEMGFIPEDKPASNNIVSYWRVDNIEQALNLYLERGALAGEPIQDVGEGIKVATIVDLFGNQFGLIENPLFQLEH